MKKYSMMTIDLRLESIRVSDHPSTWNYVACTPEMSTKRDVYEKLKELTKVYGPPIDTVGTLRRHLDPKTNASYMFAIIEDKTKELFRYSERERQKLQGDMK